MRRRGRACWRAWPGSSRGRAPSSNSRSAEFYVDARPIPLDENAAKLLDGPARQRLAALTEALRAVRSWERPGSRRACARRPRRAASARQLAQPLRAALTGATASPGIFEVMAVLGREEVLARLADASGRGYRSAASRLIAGAPASRSAFR